MPLDGPDLRNPQWVSLRQMHGVPLLPPMFAPTFGQVRFGAQELAHVAPLNFKAQAQLQAQQIDSAIQLLKMQYDAIMSSVEKSAGPSEVAANQSPSSTAPDVVDQSSFAADFELPRVDSACAQLCQKRKQPADDSAETGKQSEPAKKRSAVQRRPKVSSCEK
jgi:hypothetical protein